MIDSTNKRTKEKNLQPLPEGWSWNTLRGVLSTIESGGRPKGGARGITEGVPSVGGEHLLYKGGFNFQEIKYIPKDYFARMTRGKIERFDVLVVKDGATTGKSSFVGDDFPFDNAAVNEHVFIMRPKEILLSKYLFYWFQSPFGQDCVSDNFRGAAQGGITLDILDNSKFPLAPIDKQKGIVARLEELLSDLEAGVAAMERVRVGVKRYNASVLKAACEGKLFGNKRKKNWELPEGWRWIKFGDLISSGPTNGLYLPKNRYGSGIPILRIDDYQNGFSRSSGELRLVNDSSIQVAKYSLKECDLVINRVNSPSHLGKCLVVTQRNLPALFESNMMCIRLNVGIVHPKYLEFYLQSVDGKKRLTSNAKWAVNQASINQQDVIKTPVPLPPLEEQRSIVTEIERRLELGQIVEVAAETGLKRAARLRQVVLNAAFEGKLS